MMIHLSMFGSGRRRALIEMFAVCGKQVAGSCRKCAGEEKERIQL